MLYLHIFLITMHEIDTAAEVDLEPFQTYMIEIFCENGYSFCLLTRIEAPYRKLARLKIRLLATEILK